jgi:hypothetical protein
MGRSLHILSEKSAFRQHCHGISAFFRAITVLKLFRILAATILLRVAADFTSYESLVRDAG